MSDYGRTVGDARKARSGKAGGVLNDNAPFDPAKLEEGELIIPLKDLVGPEGGVVMQYARLYETTLRDAKQFASERNQVRDMCEAWKGENELIARQRDAARAEVADLRKQLDRATAALSKHGLDRMQREYIEINQALRESLTNVRKERDGLQAQLNLTLAAKRTQKTHAKRARGQLREARIEAEHVRSSVQSIADNLRRVSAGEVTPIGIAIELEAAIR